MEKHHAEKSAPPTDSSSSCLARHDFLLRRLHSLSGLVPVGAYMCIHLLTNASVLDSAATYQQAVYQIHGLGKALPIIEWLFIFLPILFHAIFGVIIIRSGVPNHGIYPYGSNVRYTLQRATGMIAFLFIMWHVFHMHGWFHFEGWLSSVRAAGGAKFAPYNAASSLGAAMAGVVVQGLYAIGVLSCVFHLANGIWTAGITWGVWVTPAAQQWALKACSGFGVVMAVVGMSALYGAATVNVDAAKQKEDQLYKARVEAGQMEPNEHKRTAAAGTEVSATQGPAHP